MGRWGEGRHPLIQFERAKQSGPKNSHNDALVITVLLANYESSLGLVVWEKYKETPSNFTNVMWKLYVKAREETRMNHLRRHPRASGGRRLQKIRKVREHPPKVQPAEELMNVELILGDLEKSTRIGSQMEDTMHEEVIQCLRFNVDIFAWTSQDLEGIDPNVITHHLNIDPNIKLVKQKKRNFGPEKDKIIQAEVDKLLATRHIKEIQFFEWLTNVILVPSSGENGGCVSTLRISRRHAPRIFILYHKLIN
ncbi:UNVERIFIED_CONTAM: hypothetical protein Sindi_2455200 [Sesamum indicum]